ncbi:MAG: heme exporter protein CcmB [Acidobacteriota bacterium]|nr:heme exporter protein CcmB [Acidobacteriota bacterium]
MTRLLAAAWLIARKDFTIEARSREIVATAAFFAVACVLVFSFSLVTDGRAPDGVAAGVLWVGVAFSGTLSLARLFERERAHDTLRTLLLAPVERPAVYLGKLVAVVMLMSAIAALLLPLTGFLFDQAVVRAAPWLGAVMLLGIVGFAAVGTLFAAMLGRTRSRDVLLPVLLYPMAVPVLIAGVRATAALLEPAAAGGPDWETARLWMGVLAAFDAVFVTLALWTFEAVMEE